MKKIDLPTNNVPLVIVGDVIKVLKLLPERVINVAVTSPPYWNLRDYQTKGQIGQEKNPEKYIEKIADVGKEVRRVLKNDGAYFLNIGDTYNDKNMLFIPEKVAIRMQNNGWIARNFIVWHKPNHMPSPFKTRFTSTWEPIFFFTKDDWEKQVYFDMDAIRVKHKTIDEKNNIRKDQLELPITSDINELYRKEYSGKFKGQEKNRGASPGARLSIYGEKYIIKRKYQVNQKVIADYLKFWRIKNDISAKDLDRKFGYSDTAGHWFRKDAGGSLPTPEDWKKLKRVLKFDNKYDKEMTELHLVLQTVRHHPNGKNPGDLWEFTTAKLKDAHFAVFPEELPRRAIKACCPPDGVVLDPFAGSGTTAKVAKELGRKSVMIELNKKYIDIIKKRCGEINVLII